MSSNGAQGETLRALFWAHVSTDGHGQHSILQTSTPGRSPRQETHETTTSPSEDCSSRRSSSSASITSSLSATESKSSQAKSEAISPIRVKIQRTSQKRKPVLRRSCTPVTESLREIRQRQSEETLRQLYEAQTLAYLNDAIRF